MLAIIILSITLVASLIFLKLIFSKSSSSVKNGSKILFCGTRDAGKTTLLSRIVNEKPDNKDLKTQTSQKVNVYPFGFDSSAQSQANQTTKFSLVDIPGHERVRLQALEKHIDNTKGLIFVIDAGKVRDDIRDSAEYLVNILSNESLYKRTGPSKSDKCKVLIIGNKQDTALAKSVNAIKLLLEKEIDILKTINKRSGVQNLKATNQMDNDSEFTDKDRDNADEIFFQGEGQFTFDQLKNFEVQFLGTSCVVDDENFSFEPVSRWVREMTTVE